MVIGKLALVAPLLALLAPIGYRRQQPFVSVAALALLLLASCTRFSPRPELASFVLLAAVLRLLDRFERTGGGPCRRGAVRSCRSCSPFSSSIRCGSASIRGSFAALGRSDLALATWEQGLTVFADARDGEKIRSMLLERLGAGAGQR